jgi:hypothetical protein
MAQWRVRDASELIYPAVQETLASLGLLAEDSAAKKLAQQLARVIDSQDGHCRGCADDECRRSQTSAWAMRWLSPLLMDTLEALSATPRARAAQSKGQKPNEPKPGGLAALRAAK